MAGPRHGSVRPANSKVPDVTPWFWVLKLLITCMGEGISDYLAATINPYLAVGVGLLIWAAVMVWVFSSSGYKISTYWTGVAAVAIFGTMPPDALHIQFGVPYAATSALFAICVAVVLVVWYRSEHTLDIHSITNQRRALFYWLLVICTFALGTALGDLVATPLHLGFLAAGILFSVLILIPLAAWRLGANPVLTFWVAYILTRPIGASFADYVGQPKSISGLGLGHPVVFITTGVLTIAIIVYLKVTGKDILPVPAESRVPVSGYSDRAYAEEAYGGRRPGDVQPGYGQPEYVQPEYGQPGYGQQPPPPSGW